MTEGLEVIIKYCGKKYEKVACPKSASSEFAILKRDLDYLRVHSPSQKNVLRVDGSFVLHWPNATLSPKVLTGSLHTRWFKMCSDDPQALELRNFLSIESITMKQDGVLIMCSAPAAGVASTKDLPEPPVRPLTEATAPALKCASPLEPPPPSPPPAPVKEASAMKDPPTAPRADRQQLPTLKRQKSTLDGPPNHTRQKLDTPERSALRPHLQLTMEPALDHPESSFADPDSMEISPPREAGEVTPRAIPHSARSPTESASLSGGPRLLPPRSVLLRYNSSSSSSASGGRHHRHSPLALHPQRPLDASRRRDHDVNQLTRELWDTRRQLVAMRVREQAILNDIERYGMRAPAAEAEVEVRAESAGAGADSDVPGENNDRNWNGTGVSREDLQAMETELREERARRMRAERALGDVERECRAPFVVPALFQAFMSISELSS